ncbi:hypothetical protein HPB48_004448 [Haemaphysalis longicornis]|uniref:Uncharacterized protein n=1 Tax=Haemaphysalis longicornis TaxID=44386 RepID=A0A9J6FRG2_HAELO|nr:hypothetical protein HPB48_004448 [Haemaphysalis longicornis]
MANARLKKMCKRRRLRYVDLGINGFEGHFSGDGVSYGGEAISKVIQKLKEPISRFLGADCATLSREDSGWTGNVVVNPENQPRISQAVSPMRGQAAAPHRGARGRTGGALQSKPNAFEWRGKQVNLERKEQAQRPGPCPKGWGAKTTKQELEAGSRSSVVRGLETWIQEVISEQLSRSWPTLSSPTGVGSRDNVPTSTTTNGARGMREEGEARSQQEAQEEALRRRGKQIRCEPAIEGVAATSAKTVQYARAKLTRRRCRRGKRARAHKDGRCNTFAVGLLNMQGGRTKMKWDEIFHHCKKDKIDIFGVTETHLRETELPPLERGFEWEGLNRKTEIGGVVEGGDMEGGPVVAQSTRTRKLRSIYGLPAPCLEGGQPAISPSALRKLANQREEAKWRSDLLAEARLGSLRTRVWRKRTGGTLPTECVACGVAEESEEHILLHCTAIKPAPSAATLEEALGFRRHAPHRHQTGPCHEPESSGATSRRGEDERCSGSTAYTRGHAVQASKRRLEDWCECPWQDSADSENPEEDFRDLHSPPSFLRDSDSLSPDSADLESPEEDSESDESPEEDPNDNDSPVEEDSLAPKSGKPAELASPAVLKRLKGRFTGATLDCQLPCTAAKGKTCQIFHHLSTWNEFLCQSSLLLRETTGTAGNLALLFCYRHSLTAYSSEQQRHQIYTLVYWLLKIHRCIVCVELFVPALDPYGHFLFNALQGNSHLRSLKLSFNGRNSRQDFALNIPSLSHLEELECAGEPPATLAAMLSRLLRASTSLTSLRIFRMAFKGPSVEDLFRALGENCSLEELALPDSAIINATPTTRAVFTEFLKNSTSLKSLSFEADKSVPLPGLDS